MSCDGWRDDLDDAEYCASCKLELPKARDYVRRLGAKTVCVLCFDMADAINENQYMKDLQQNYRKEQENLKKLKPGEDYFK